MADQILAIIAFVCAVLGGTMAILYIAGLWMYSRETHIEPIVSEGGKK